MIEVLALCSCACITTCFWCAVTALTCPRIVNVPAHYEGPRICESSCPFKFYYLKNWAELGTPLVYPDSNCPNISYPILICPMKYPSQSFLSTSASVQETNSEISSTSNPEPKISRVKKNQKLSPRNIEGNLSYFDSNSERDLIFEDENFTQSPIPPPRLRRNRNKSLKSIIKSKFKRRDSEINDLPVSRPLDKGTETDFLQSKEHQISGRRTRFQCLKKMCHVSRFKRSPAESKTFKYPRCSKSASHVLPSDNLLPIPKTF